MFGTDTESSRLVDAINTNYTSFREQSEKRKSTVTGSKPLRTAGVVALFTVILLAISKFLFSNESNEQKILVAEDTASSQIEIESLETSTATSPNIIFILLDDFGYSDISARGAEFNTPNFDKLYDKCILIESHYIGLVCSPSRSQMITGRYAWNLGLSDMTPFDAVNLDALPGALPTIGDLLGLYTNYKRYWTGKWHVGMTTSHHLPLQRGFEKFYGFYSANIDYEDKLIKTGYYDTYYMDWRAMDEVDYDTQYNYSTFVTRDYVLDIINDHVDTYGSETDTSEKTPFYLEIAFQATHAVTVSVESENSAQCQDISDSTRSLMCETILAVDEVLGNIVTNLKQDTKIWDDTLIVLTADNGASFQKGGCNYPLRGGKQNFFEGGVRTFAMLAGGYVENEANVNLDSVTKRDGLMHGVDWVPSLLKIAGVDLDQIESDLVDTLYEPVAKAASLAETGSEDDYNNYLIKTPFDGMDVSEWLLTGTEELNQRDAVPLSINDVDADVNGTGRETDVALVFVSKYTGNMYKWMDLEDAMSSRTRNTELCVFRQKSSSASKSNKLEEMDEMDDLIDVFEDSEQIWEDVDVEDEVESFADVTDDYEAWEEVLEVAEVKSVLESAASGVGTKSARGTRECDKILSEFASSQKFLFDLSQEENELTNLMEYFLDDFEDIAVEENDELEYLEGVDVTGLEEGQGYDEKLVSLIWREGRDKAKEFLKENVVANDYLHCQHKQLLNDADPEQFENGDAYSPFYSWKKYVHMFEKMCSSNVNPVLKVLFETKFGDYFG